uniref:Putative Holliday junction resolvase (Modular protein) n=1 Tax=mine drainage metagenome TaxID=410659 RepID=E6QLN4_9ZZZZ
MADRANNFSEQNPELDRELEPEQSSAARFLGLDVGNKRIGVAVSDPLGLTAQPVLTLNRKPNPRDDMRSLARLARRFGCVGLVVGLPMHLSGEISTQAAKIQRFAEQLATLAGLPLTLWDERLTTRAAHEILYAAGKDRKQHKTLVDQVAATLILQSFLDANPAQSTAPPPSPTDPNPSSGPIP